MYNFCICAVFKNESHILEEWLLHYIHHGVEHFYLINDNSDDNFETITNKYSRYITLFHNDIQTKKVGRQSMIYFINILKNIVQIGSESGERVLNNLFLLRS